MPEIKLGPPTNWAVKLVFFNPLDYGRNYSCSSAFDCPLCAVCTRHVCIMMRVDPGINALSCVALGICKSPIKPRHNPGVFFPGQLQVLIVLLAISTRLRIAALRHIMSIPFIIIYSHERAYVAGGD